MPSSAASKVPLYNSWHSSIALFTCLLLLLLTQTLEDMKQDGTIGRVAEKFGLDAEKTVWGEQGK